MTYRGWGSRLPGRPRGRQLLLRTQNSKIKLYGGNERVSNDTLNLSIYGLRLTKQNRLN